MPEEPNKTPKFEAAQPRIPGVPVRDPRKSARGGQFPSSYIWAGGGGAILVVVIAILWWAHGTTRAVAPAAPPPQTAASPAPSRPVETIPVAPGVIATTSDLKDAWSVKKFLYHYPNGDTFPALLVRLPGDSYWAISLREQFDSCDLEFADVNKLRTDYNVIAKHPMVGDPCTHTVYDLERYGNGPNGLVRGAVVAGLAVRPPLAIEVEVQGHEIVASRSE
jgi:hypothetical protein